MPDGSGTARPCPARSAHVTLGRSLIEVGQYDEAREELEFVLRAAPENLAAIRGLAEIHHRLDASVHAQAGPTPERAHTAPPLVPMPPHPSLAALEAFLAGVRLAREARTAARR